MSGRRSARRARRLGLTCRIPAIVAAIGRRDPEAAAQAMDEHLVLSHRRLLPTLRKGYTSEG